VSDAVSALIKKGLLNRRRAGKTAKLSLTKQGAELVEKLNDWRKLAGELFAGVDVKSLYKNLLQYILNLQKAGFIDIHICLTCKHFKDNYCTLLNRKLEILDVKLNCPRYEQRASPPRVTQQ